ncbi:hypothetical protein [Peteryoungia ipomoeae]|nr:hypothetical protein [Peteryoungia ipomoeae]
MRLASSLALTIKDYRTSRLSQREELQSEKRSLFGADLGQSIADPANVSE